MYLGSVINPINLIIYYEIEHIQRSRRSTSPLQGLMLYKLYSFFSLHETQRVLVVKRKKKFDLKKNYPTR